MKHWWNINKMAFTDVFWLYCKDTRQIIFVFVFEGLWVLCSVHYSRLYYIFTVLPHSTRVIWGLPWFMLWCLVCTFIFSFKTTIGSIGYHLPQQPHLSTVEDILSMVFFLLNQTLQFWQKCGSSFSLADAVSPLIFICFSPKLFLNMCNHPLFAVNGLVSLSSENPFLKSLYRHNASWCNTTPYIWTHFSVHVFHAQMQCLFHLHQSPVTHCDCNYCSLRCDSKTNTNFFFLFQWFHG